MLYADKSQDAVAGILKRMESSLTAAAAIAADDSEKTNKFLNLFRGLLNENAHDTIAGAPNADQMVAIGGKRSRVYETIRKSKKRKSDLQMALVSHHDSSEFRIDAVSD
jgi:hypothetical protein